MNTIETSSRFISQEGTSDDGYDKNESSKLYHDVDHNSEETSERDGLITIETKILSSMDERDHSLQSSEIMLTSTMMEFDSSQFHEKEEETSIMFVSIMFSENFRSIKQEGLDSSYANIINELYSSEIERMTARSYLSSLLAEDLKSLFSESVETELPLNPTPDENIRGSSKTGMVVGIVVGAIVIIILIALLIIFLIKKDKALSYSTNVEDTEFINEITSTDFLTYNYTENPLTINTDDLFSKENYEVDYEENFLAQIN